MNRTFLSAALGLGLLTSAAFAQQSQQQPATPDATQAAPGQHFRHRQPNPQRQAEMLSKRLNLSPDQTAKLEPILADREQKMAALRQDTSLTPEQRHEQMRAIHQSTEQQFQSVLTPDQLQQMKQMHHGRRGQWQNGQGQPAAPSGL